MVTDIIVIGGGAAGLIAARRLAQAGNDVTVIEAGKRLGGRMYTINGNGFTAPVEAGAEFIHGDVEVTLGLLKEAGIGYTRTAGKMYRSNNGKWQEEEEMIDGWDELTEKMNTLTEDKTLQAFLQLYFAGDKYAALRTQVNNFAEGFDVADPAKVSVFMLRDEWEHEGPNYRVNGGYITLVNYLENECLKAGASIQLGEVVKAINWSAGEVKVYTNAATYRASKVLVTIPIALLQNNQASNAIKFTPHLTEYTKAANDIGYGNVVKVILEFSKPFWNEHKKNAGFIISNEFMPVWWTQYPDKATTLTGWLGGPKASALRGVSKKEILEKSLNALCSIFNIILDEMNSYLIASEVFDWQENLLSAGAYSYATPATKKALDILIKPMDNTIYFAGEAVYNGEHPGTVEAALVSGLNAAAAILESL